MAQTHLLISTSLLLLIFTLAGVSYSADSSSPANIRELESMMETLRPLGYTLFCNAITTSDLQFQILTTQSSSSLYTIFAAKDPFLYALDLASDAQAYVSTLRYHVSPNRLLTLSDLRSLHPPFLETLLPHYNIMVTKTRLNNSRSSNSSIEVVRVDGVRVSDPDMFVGSRIVVHGLDGILVTGIVKDDDLVDVDRSLGLGSGAPAAEESPEVVSTPEEGYGVAAPVVVAMNVSDGGEGAKHEPVAKKGNGGGKEARKGEKRQAVVKKGSSDGGNGVKEARRGVKHQRVVAHQNLKNHHQVVRKSNNRNGNHRRQNRRVQVHQKEDL